MDVLHELHALTNRNKIILNNTYHHAVKNEVNLHWYKYSNDQLYNLGDYLSTVVYEYMLDKLGLDPHQKVPKTRHLLAIGSVLTQGYQNATVWGSGMIASDSPKHRISLRIKNLDIRAVRGPLTREVLQKYGHSCPPIYGDPAVLMPLIYANRCDKRYDVTLVDHHSAPFANDMTENVHRLNIMTKDYPSFIDEIIASKLVISSSLHGIILAEAYGVPAIWLGTPSLNPFKYQDWYLSTGRKNVSPVCSIADAIKATPPELPEISEMQSQLFQCFPLDLWNN